jgi:hypothetical protein
MLWKNHSQANNLTSAAKAAVQVRIYGTAEAVPLSKTKQKRGFFAALRMTIHDSMATIQ